MKKLLIFLFLGCCAGQLSAQQETNNLRDLVITVNGDSIRCRVKSVNEGNMDITLFNEQAGLVDLRLDTKYIRSTTLVYYPEYPPYPESRYAPTPGREIIYTGNRDVTDDLEFGSYPIRKDPFSAGNSMRFRINFGYSALIEGVDAGDYIEDSKVTSGFNLGLSPTYAFTGGFCELGATLDFRFHSIQQWKINTTFIAPVFAVNFPGPTGNFGFIDVAPGYVHYKETHTSRYYKVNTFGTKISLGYAVKGKSAGVEFRLAFLVAGYRNAKTNIPQEPTHFNDPQSISSVNLSIGFVFGR